MRTWLMMACLWMAEPVRAAGGSDNSNGPEIVAGRGQAGWAVDLESPDPIVRLRAVRSLQAFGVAAVGPLSAALKDGDDGVRAAAAEALGELGPPAVAARAQLEQLLDDRAIGVRLYAAFALYRQGERGRPAKIMTEALKIPTRGVANTAAELLGRAAVREALPALTAALEHQDYHIQGAAQHAIARIRQRHGNTP